MKICQVGRPLVRFAWLVLVVIVKLIVVLIGQEILRRKRTEARTKSLARHEAQSRMNEFVSIAGHELKTPLTSIKGNIQLMGRRLKNSIEVVGTQPDTTARLLTEVRELLERTDRQITQLTRLINSLLESSRIYANTMDLLFELCELNRIIQEVTQEKRYLPVERTVHVTLPEKKAVLVMADANRIKQVMIHYLSNAHKYSALDRPIDVHLSEEGSMAFVSVRDEGPGIPQNEQQRIWERFYRVPSIEIKTGSEVGLGLGLHISRTIIEQHHGQVGVQSKPGAGSTFWFTLPLLRENGQKLP
ncbi:MAG: HAMP domain-containing histidine kinase [Chloroflexi bacterium]|nr:HAMP domain-containing histidine kinase [Chloroflexota bacterium]